jgi:hypothetical protein
MKRLTLIAVAMLAALLVLRPSLLAQNEVNNPDTGGMANDPGQDNDDQQVTPDQPPEGENDTANQNNDPDAAADQNDQNGQNGQNDQNNQNDNNQADTGAGDDANAANQ